MIARACIVLVLLLNACTTESEPFPGSNAPAATQGGTSSVPETDEDSAAINCYETYECFYDAQADAELGGYTPGPLSDCEHKRGAGWDAAVEAWAQCHTYDSETDDEDSCVTEVCE